MDGVYVTCSACMLGTMFVARLYNGMHVLAPAAAQHHSDAQGLLQVAAAAGATCVEHVATSPQVTSTSVLFDLLLKARYIFAWCKRFKNIMCSLICSCAALVCESLCRCSLMVAYVCCCKGLQ